MSALYSQIEPLAHIAVEARRLYRTSLIPGITRREVATKIARRGGLLEAARWILMAQKERDTGHPQPLLNDSDVEIELAGCLATDH